MALSLKVSRDDQNEADVLGVVIEIGSRIISAGFVGEVLPRCVRSTFLKSQDRFRSGSLPPSFGLESRSLTPLEKQTLYNALVEEQPALEILSHVYTQQQNHWLSSADVGSLSCGDRERLLIILHDLFVRELQILPAACRVILVFSNWSITSQESILRSLLNVLGVKLVSLPPAPPLLIIASGNRHGLVLDFGWECARIIPVYDLRDVSLTGTIVEFSTKFTGKELHFLLIRHLIDDGVDMASIPNLFQVIQAFVTRAMYVKPKDAEEDKHPDFELSPGVFVSSTLKWRPIEASLFADTSLIDAIGSLISRSPIDLRRDLWGNIVLEGGLSKIPGIRSRLNQELCLRHPEVTTINVCDTLGSWTGASMYGKASLKPGNVDAWKREEFDRVSFASLERRDGSAAFTQISDQNF